MIDFQSNQVHINEVNLAKAAKKVYNCFE
jgi:hypothetical protein